MGRIITSATDCKDCLCRICAHSDSNDSYNKELGPMGYKKCTCGCNIGDKLIETEDDCPNYLPDEEN